MADDISKIYIWIVVAIGLPGNILVAVALLTMQKFAPATFFVVVQAILDAASLVGKLTAHQLLRNNVYIGDIGCKSYFLTIFSGTLANWILLLICTERFVTVCYPDRKPLIFTKSNCYVAVSVLSAVFLAFFAGVTCAMRGLTPLDCDVVLTTSICGFGCMFGSGLILVFISSSHVYMFCP